jgi:hypothetical protein
MNSNNFCLVNTDVVPSLLRTSDNEQHIVNDYLFFIEQNLDTLLKFDVTITEENLTFENLMIIEVSSGNSLFTQELDRFSFDFNRCVVSSIYNHRILKSSIIIGRIQTKINRLMNNNVVSNNNKRQVFHKSTTVVSKKPIITINTPRTSHTSTSTNTSTYTYTNKLREMVDNNDNKLNTNNTMLIPKMPDLDDTESISSARLSECDEDYSNELGINRPLGTIVTPLGQDFNVELIDTEDENIDLGELKEQIELLKQLKEQGESKVEQLEEINIENVENLTRYFNNLNDEKRFHKVDMERANEKRRIFYANKRAYYMIEEDINSGKTTVDKISPLIKDQYPIYKFMDDQKLLDQYSLEYNNSDSDEERVNDKEYELYLNLFNKLYPNGEKIEHNGQQTPYNFHYLTNEEKKKYIGVKTEFKDEIDQFIDEHCANKKKYESLEDVLANLRDLDEEDGGNKEDMENEECVEYDEYEYIGDDVNNDGSDDGINDVEDILTSQLSECGNEFPPVENFEDADNHANADDADNHANVDDVDDADNDADNHADDADNHANVDDVDDADDDADDADNHADVDNDVDNDADNDVDNDIVECDVDDIDCGQNAINEKVGKLNEKKTGLFNKLISTINSSIL